MEVEIKVRRHSLCAAAWLAASSLLPAPAQARSDPEVVVDAIHSALPLYNFDWEGLWPRGFVEGDSFGCNSRVGLGDWRFAPAEANGQGQETWYRFGNYGVFHCAAIFQRADEQAGLATAQAGHGFFVRLGTARHRSAEWELWALQWGMRPGSDYTLLAREANGAGLIVEFRVLQQRCPRGMIREARGLDVWSTRYCAIDSRAALVSLARSMLRLPAAGTVVRVTEGE